MNKFIFAFFLSFSTLGHAEAYLCVTNSIAGVLHKGKKFKSVAYDNVSSIKYVIANDLGKWKLKKMGEEFDALDQCPSSQYCISTRGYAGVFIRSKDGTFTVSWLHQTDDGWLGNYIAKGICSEI